MIQTEDHVLTVNVWWEPKRSRTKLVKCHICNGTGRVFNGLLECTNCWSSGELIINNEFEPTPEIPQEFVAYIQKCYEEYCLGGLHKLHKEN